MKRKTSPSKNQRFFDTPPMEGNVMPFCVFVFVGGGSEGGVRLVKKWRVVLMIAEN
ncbi:hypothetical protein [Chryseobacterium turcicum]|uniref:Uncharacterized protein n=1 Tax=Chryseobacterium turcicum TaxID=2898076 RepID=A0A9Q3UZF9_9FLAO|nr:hypothetical protein [Chryseobacterium turcicum]MCD1116064.1 hypothetical protein [Chryseobacterium turcicum]